MSTEKIQALADEYVAACARAGYMGMEPVLAARNALHAAVDVAVAEEREACAKVCDRHCAYGLPADNCASSIRARSTK